MNASLNQVRPIELIDRATRPVVARHGLLSIRRAFTLIEVLVVVAIIALLVAILIPSLLRVREQATGVVCMSNIRQLGMAMQIYTAEHKRLPGNSTVYWHAFQQAGRPGGDSVPDYPPSDSWLGLPETGNSGWSGVTNGQELWNFLDSKDVPRSGSLYRYAKNPSVYLCPKDKRGRPNSEDTKGGGGNGLFSYTMNVLLGYQAPEDVTSFKYITRFEPEDGAQPPPQPVIRNGTRIQWSPAGMPLLFEEHPWNNTNNGRPKDELTVDAYLVMRHSPQNSGKGRTPIAFIDGHVEQRIYPYFAGQWVGPQGEVEDIKLLGLDVYNDFQLPVYWIGAVGGQANFEAFLHKFRYPYND